MRTVIDFSGLQPSRLAVTEWIGRYERGSDRLDAKLSQSIDDRLDQPFDLPVIGVTDMLIATSATDVCCQVVELAPDRTDLQAAKAFG